MGKISQRPHKQLEERATKVPLELIHIDVCGPLPTKSQGGNRYILVIVDDYSRYICTYFMQNKTDVYKYFVEYVNRYENDLNRKLKKVRNDNGTEFTNKEFENYINRRGIKHERTVAYNPQSNGVVERSNRILLDKSRTLLIDAQLPMNFWAEAVATATYLRNVSLSKGGNNKTPIEMWSSKKPTVSYLKIFGCLTYYYLPKVQRNKLQPKARKGIFIGYSQETRGYRIYDPEYRKIYAVRTAKFNENLKGSELLNNDNENGDDNIILYDNTKQDGDEEKTDEENPVDRNDEEREEEEDNASGREEINEEERPEDRTQHQRGRKPGITNEEIKNTRKMEL